MTNKELIAALRDEGHLGQRDGFAALLDTANKAAQALEAQEWRDIESAPKDGTVIDLWDSQGFRKPDCAWDKKAKAWLQPYARPRTKGAQVHYIGNPTHWKPLTPPETE